MLYCRAKKDQPPSCRRCHLAFVQQDGKYKWKFNTPGECCAERKLLEKLDTPPSNMIVVQIRWKKHNKFSIGNSRPCERCRLALLASDVRPRALTYSIYNQGTLTFSTVSPDMLEPNDYSASA